MSRTSQVHEDGGECAQEKIGSTIRTREHARLAVGRLRTTSETRKRTMAFVLVPTLLSISGCAQVNSAPKQNHVSIVGSGRLVSPTRPSRMQLGC
jgi:hypothetical protein